LNPPRLPDAPRSAAYLAGLAHLVEHMPVVAWSTDPQLRITSIAGGAADRIGRSASEVVGLSIGEFFGDPEHPVVIHHRTALRGEPVSYALEWQGRTYDVTIEQLHAADGSVVGVVGMGLDVTERVAALSALETSEGSYRTLVDDAAVGIFRSSPEGKFLAVNPALVAMLGYASAEEMRGLNLAADVYIDPMLRRRLTDRYADADRIAGVDVEWRRKDGSAITVRLSGRPVRDGSGVILSWEMVAEDVTEFRRIEHQLRQAQKMEAIGRLTGGIAHDFNNILTAILANADLIEDALPETETQIRSDLHDIVEAARRGTDLVKKLLGFSRRERLQILPAHLPGTVSKLAGDLEPLLPAGSRLVVQSPGDDFPLVLLDRSAVEQILVSLIANARDAMPRGGTLSIGFVRADLDESYREAHGWGTPGEYVLMTIRDTGPGMDEETRSRAFEPFFTTKPPGAGSGLGLAMVYGLMKQMNGFVRLESAPGEGTTVTLFFPVTHRRTTPQPRPALAAKPGGKVLVVEDEEPIRRVARRVLERFGYSVLDADNGEAALRLYTERSEEISLVVTDVVMPRMGGRELYEALRKGGSSVPVIFTSGYTQRGEMDGEAGGLDPSVPFLAKPWSAEELIARVRESLRT
jgi:two-component system cell cycle sensor histidine kinase/response regulator CckA